MDQQHHTAMASIVAVSSMAPSPEARKKVIQDLFDRRDREIEAVRKARQVAKYQEQKAVLKEKYKIDPMAMQMIMKLYSLTEARRAKVWYQVITMANDAGLDVDVPYENEPDEEAAVFDSTKTGKRQGGTKVGPEALPQARKDSETVTRTRINMKMAEEMLKRLHLGLPLRHKPGRPSNEERAAIEWAQSRYQQELTEQEERPGEESPEETEPEETDPEEHDPVEADEDPGPTSVDEPNVEGDGSNEGRGEIIGRGS